MSFLAITRTGKEHRIACFDTGKQDDGVSQVVQAQVGDSLEVLARTEFRCDEGSNVVDSCQERRVCDITIPICVGIVFGDFGEDSLRLRYSSTFDYFREQAFVRHDEVVNGVA